MIQPKTKKKRNGYYYTDGLELPSITKILGDTLAKNNLIFWLKREAIRFALKNPELNETEIMALFEIDSSKRTDRGHYVHSIAEIMPNVDIDKIQEENKGYIKGLIGWWNKYKPVVLNRELEAYNKELGYGCRVDFVCIIRDKIWVIDFKSSKDGAIYKDVGLQLVAGKLALLETHDIKVDHMGVVALSEQGEDTFRETKDTKEDLIHLVELYKWSKRKGE